MVEDFTHVLPEDKAVPTPKRQFADQVFDLAEANKSAKYFQELRKEIEAIERHARQKILSPR